MLDYRGESSMFDGPLCYAYEAELPAPAKALRLVFSFPHLVDGEL